MQQQIVECFYWLILILIIDSDANFPRIPVGYSYIVLLGAISSVESAPNCIISKDGKSADCSNSHVKKIPDDLDSMITSLDLSLNPFSEMRESSFKKYTQLTSLMLRGIQLDVSEMDLYLFRPLKNLKVLNLSGSDFSERAYFYYPENLKILNINGLGVRDVDISRLKFLEELHAKENNLLELPISHNDAVLKVIDLESNFLETLTPVRLALLCKLQVLNVQLHEQARLISNDSRNCLCKRANLWIDSVQIKGKKLPCKQAVTDERCEEPFSEDTFAVYNECSSRNGKKTSIWVYVLVVVLIVLALIGSSAAGYYFYITKIKPASSSSEQVQEPEAKTDVDED